LGIAFEMPSIARVEVEQAVPNLIDADWVNFKQSRFVQRELFTLEPYFANVRGLTVIAGPKTLDVRSMVGPGFGDLTVATRPTRQDNEPRAKQIKRMAFAGFDPTTVARIFDDCMVPVS
jgi:hypothetical protein